MTEPPHTERGHRTAFAEIAEALGIPGDQIESAVSTLEAASASRVDVPFRNPADSHRLFGQVLSRDADGVLRPVGRPRECPDMFMPRDRAMS